MDDPSALDNHPDIGRFAQARDVRDDIALDQHEICQLARFDASEPTLHEVFVAVVGGGAAAADGIGEAA